MNDKFDVVISDPDGNYRATLREEAEGLVFSDVAPGGNHSARFLLRRPVKLTYDDLGYNFDVQIIDYLGCVWRGRIDRFRGVFDQQHEYIEITAVQSNADDQIYEAKTFASGTSIQACMDTVRTDLMPKVTLSTLVASGRTLSADLIATGKRAHETLNLLRKFGNSSDGELYWYIRGDGAANAYQLTVEAKPSTTAYYIAIGDIQTVLGFDGSQYGNKQRVLYNAGVSWASATDSTAQGAFSAGGVNLVREGPVIEAPDVTSATDAGRIAAVALASRKQLRVTAEDATVAAGATIQDANRDYLVPWRMLAGKILTIEGPQPGGAVNSLTFDRGNFFIVQREYDVDAGMLRLTFENFATTIEGMLARLIRRTEI